MEAQNLLAHHVQVGGPVFVVVVVGVVAVAKCGDIVAQGVHPDVHGVLGVEGDGDAPLDRGAGDAGVLQALLDEGDHLVLAALGLDELGVLLVQLEQAVGVLAGAEEVGFLVGVVDLAAAVGALAVHQLAVGPEALAGLAVVAHILALVDVALLVQLGKDLLAGLDVVVVGGADEAVVADVQQLPQVLDGGDDAVHILFGLHPGGRGLVLDLLAVLVGAGQEHHVVPLLALEAGQRVTGHGGVAVADVQLVAGVVDRGGDVELFLFRHGEWFPPFDLHSGKEAKSSRPCRALSPCKDGSRQLPWYHLGSPAPHRARPYGLLRRKGAAHTAGRGNGRTRRRLGVQRALPARLQGHLPRPDACPVPPPRALCKGQKARTLLFTADIISRLL